MMPHTPLPLVPIVIHPGSGVQPLQEDEATKTFFCLDSAEFGQFGDRLSSKVAEIRSKAGSIVPIVVVGVPANEQRQVHDEANRVAEAGAIYFERPTRQVSIDELANTIVEELTRILNAPDSFAQEAKQPSNEVATEHGNGNEQAFYVDAPFRLPEASLRALLHRFEMSDTDPQKDD
jgi:hypothetical protein